MTIATTEVLGGIAAPTFVILGRQLCDNREFHDDTTGWLGWNGGTISRVADAYNIYGDYSLRVYDDSGAVYEGAQYAFDMTSGQRYLARLLIRRHVDNDAQPKVEWMDLDNNNLGTVSWTSAVWSARPDSEYNVITNLSDPAEATGEGEFIVRVAASAASDTGYAYLAHVGIWEVEDVIELTLRDDGGYAELPSSEQHRFDPVFDYEHENDGGLMTRQIRGYRHTASLSYVLAQNQDSVDLRRLFDAGLVCYIPHNESECLYSMIGRCEGAFTAGYPQAGSPKGDKYIGHSHAPVFRAVDLVPTIPWELGT